MNDSTDQIFFDQFLDEFFVESDEHLTSIRQSLIALEAEAGAREIDPSLLEELFRQFHTVKGLAGMVGLKEAESLSHKMESYLKVLRQDPHRLSPEGTATLIEGTQALESVIAARRDKTPPPATASISERFDALIPSPTEPETPQTAPPEEASAPDPEKERAVRQTEKTGKKEQSWQFEFRPSAELSGRGVDVNSIRKRLEDTGKLIHAAPEIREDGEVFFRFVVVSRADEKVFEEWAKDGLTYAPGDEEETAEQAAAGSDPGGPPEKTAAHESVAPSNIVRVDLERVEDLMQRVGDLVISRSRFEDRVKNVEDILPASEARELHEIHSVMERQIRDLREGVMALRLVPVANVFTRMQFVTRDMASESGKKILLSMSGQETEIDKFVVERMLDPLLHLVRNAVTHGLESGEDRLKKGKPEEGNIYLRAFTEGDAVVIQVEDDGRGIQMEDVTRRARERGLIANEITPDMTTLLEILCAPAFSTRSEADLGSGRGVGMAVVKNRVEALGGSLRVETGPDKGACFTMTLPLTLAIVDALIVGVGERVFAVPKPSVREVVEFETSSISTMENNEMISYRGEVLSLFGLCPFFGIEERPKETRYALVIGQGTGTLGLVVDRVVTIREIVVQTVSDPLVKVPGILGATELGDRRAVVILDTAELSRAAQHKDTRIEIQGGVQHG